MKKILLIEPNRKLLEQTSEFFKSKDFEVITASEGSSGIQKALEYLPDIILCDSDIPDLNGYEIFNTLLQINSTAIIPFVFLMNKASNEDVRAAMNLGANDYLEKPFDQNDLLKLIEIRLEKQEKIFGLADEKFNTLMEYSTDGVFIYQDKKLSYVNKKFCEILGYSKKELVGMSLVNFIYKDDIHLVVEKIDRCLKGIFKEIKVEFRAINRDRNLISVKLFGNILKIRGRKSLVGLLRSADVYSIAKKCKSINRNDIKFTKREKEVLHLICEGHSNNEIAKKLNISGRTVEGHKANILYKTNCKNSVSLVVFAIKYDLYEIC